MFLFLHHKELHEDAQKIYMHKTIKNHIQNIIQVGILLKSLSNKKLQEHDNYPLAHRAGLIHSIPEKDLNLDTATISDVNFLSLFPKSLLKVLGGYKQSSKQNTQGQFDALIAKLLSAFVYWPILIQRIIQYLLAAMKLQLD